ncbi:hypothetical protein WJX82_010279 [Trebouxia sp. C0006]
MGQAAEHMHSKVEVAPAVGPFPRPSNVAQEACNEPHNQSSSPPGFASQAGCAPGASQQARSHRHTAGLPSAGCPQSTGSVSPEAKDRQGCSTLSWTAYPDSPTSPAAQTAPGMQGRGLPSAHLRETGHCGMQVWSEAQLTSNMNRLPANEPTASFSAHGSPLPGTALSSRRADVTPLGQGLQSAYTHTPQSGRHTASMRQAELLHLSHEGHSALQASGLQETEQRGRTSPRKESAVASASESSSAAPSGSPTSNRYKWLLQNLQACSQSG